MKEASGRYVDGQLVTDELEATLAGRARGYGLFGLEVGGSVLIAHGDLNITSLRTRIHAAIRKECARTTSEFELTTEGPAFRVRRTA